MAISMSWLASYYETGYLDVDGGDNKEITDRFN